MSAAISRTNAIFNKMYLELLKKHGFKLSRIDGEKKETAPVDTSELLKTYTPEKENYTSLLCIREDDSLAGANPPFNNRGVSGN